MPDETKKTTEKEQAETTQQPQKVYSQEEVNKMLEDEKQAVRDHAIKALVEQNAETKRQLMKSGQDDDFDLSRWQVMNKMAEDMVKSGALPKNDNAFTVMVKMQAGREMGMKPMESMKALYIVNGVVSIFGDAVIRRLREHGWGLNYTESENTCTAIIKKGKEKFTETFTFQDAELSGWTKDSYGKVKVGWVPGINRRRKLRYGAVSTLIKTYIPEVLGSAADIKEVAEDTVPLIMGKTATESVKIENGHEPAAASVIESIKNMGGVLPDEVESGERQLTKQEGSDMLKDLMTKKKGKNVNA